MQSYCFFVNNQNFSAVFLSGSLIFSFFCTKQYVSSVSHHHFPYFIALTYYDESTARCLQWCAVYGIVAHAVVDSVTIVFYGRDAGRQLLTGKEEGYDVAHLLCCRLDGIVVGIVVGSEGVGIGFHKGGKVVTARIVGVGVEGVAC